MGTHIDLMPIEKCYQASQQREHVTQIQITHAEQYRNPDRFLERIFNDHAY